MNRSNLKVAAAALGAGVLAMMMSTTAPASAVTPAQHCAQLADGSGQLSCFDTFAASVAFATAGAVQLPGTATDVTVAQLGASGSATPSASPAAQYVFSIEYVDSNHEGDSLINYWSSPCGSGTVYGSIPSSFNNKISSVRLYSGCAGSLFDGSSGGQPSYLMHAGSAPSSLGSFNDKASSHAWSANYPVAWP